MKTVTFQILVSVGVLLLVCVFLYNPVDTKQELTVVATGQVQEKMDNATFEFVYNARVRNNCSATVRLCGGRLDWCRSGGCYKVTTQFPIMLEPKQETTIAVSVSPREETLSETELILYADGEGLNGLTPIEIKLPAMSLKSP